MSIWNQVKQRYVESRMIEVQRQTQGYWRLADQTGLKFHGFDSKTAKRDLPF